MDTFHFQRVEEDSHTAIVVTTTSGAYTTLQIMAFQIDNTLNSTGPVGMNNDIFRAFRLSQMGSHPPTTTAM